MEPTIEWIDANFARFNQQYFNLELPTPRFLVIDTTKLLGQCGAKNWRAEHPDFVLKLSNHFQRTEYEYQCTLLHEMIHLYWQSKGEWNVSHGEKFVEMAMRFRELGWDVSIPRSSIIAKIKRDIRDTNVDKRKPLYTQTTTNNYTMTEQDKINAIYAQASVKWEEIWCVQTNTGIQLHCKFALNKMKDIPCVIGLSFFPAYLAQVVDDEGPIYNRIIRNQMPPVLYFEKSLNPPHESTIWNDMTFDVPFTGLSKLFSSKGSILSKLSFEDEASYLINFHIKYDMRQFSCVAIYNVDISAKKKFLQKIEYSVKCPDSRDFFNTPLGRNGECNDPNFGVSRQRNAGNNSQMRNDSMGEDSKRGRASKPRPIINNPLTEAMLKLVDERILSSIDADRIMRIDFEINEADCRYHIPWNEIYDPNAEHCLSDALTRLAQGRYLRNVRRAQSLIISLKNKGF